MKPELEIELLRFIEKMSDRRLYFIAREFNGKQSDYRVTQYSLIPMAWDWISRGLAYFDISQPAPSNWDLRLTEKGKRYIEEEEENPYNDNIWYASLLKKAVGISDIEKQYAQEAIKAFVNELYVACHVLIGVSSESVIIRMAHAMAKSDLIEGHESISIAVGNPRIGIRELFSKMRPELEKAKKRIPGNLADNMSIWLDSMFDVIRVNRNDAGHPTGSTLSKEDSIMVLRCFVTYMSKACRLINYLDETSNKSLDQSAVAPCKLKQS
ncbi:hypothetical protein [Gimesia maris]|tara:strand:+ start:37140 stop:37943 length:804 start_codon:yes stop_codon:yes gene_type:complete